MTSFLTVTDLTVEYREGVRAVDGVSFAVEQGKTMGLVGESGSGKSTIARAVMGMTPITSGSVTIGENSSSRNQSKTLRVARRTAQMVFQDPYGSLDPRMRVGRTIDEAVAANSNLSRTKRSKEVARLLGLVHLDERAVMRFPHEFSGGQRQRIAIARALACNPHLLILDEVTSALDVSVQASILNLLRDIQAELGTTYVFVSHDFAVVRYMSDNITVLRHGQMVEAGSREAIFSAPEHEYTRHLLAAVPTLLSATQR